MSHPKAANHSLAWLLCAHDSLYKLLMFGAFFDDSGTHPYAKIGALAGYVADEAEWKRFEDSWGEFLADAGIQFFHARDCVRGEKAFSGWTEAERLAYYWRAIDVIRAHHLMDVSIAGRTVDFTPERIEQARTIPSAATGPFELSAQFTFMALGQCFSKKWPGERVTIVCENGKREDNERVTRAYFDLIDAPAHAYMADLFYAQPAFFPKPHHYGL